MSQARPGPIDALDPGVRRFMDSINGAYSAHPDFASLPLPQRRALAETIRAPWRVGGPVMVETRDIAAAGVRMRLYRPIPRADLPVLLYLHGGGWTLFSIDTHDRLMREYAGRAGVAVIGIDYSLSPEARFPVALDEVAEAVGWVRGHADELGIDAGRLALGGDSAGANLAVAASIALRDAGTPLPSALLLNYGAYAAEPFASYRRFDGPDYFLEVAEMDAFWANYVRDPADLVDPLVAPLHADLTGLPPTFVAIAQCDILADCNHAFAAKLAAAGGRVEARTYHGATHSFLEAVSISALAAQAFDDEAAFLRNQLDCSPAAAI